MALCSLIVPMCR